MSFSSIFSNCATDLRYRHGALPIRTKSFLRHTEKRSQWGTLEGTRQSPWKKRSEEAQDGADCPCKHEHSQVIDLIRPPTHELSPKIRIDAHVLGVLEVLH